MRAATAFPELVARAAARFVVPVRLVRAIMVAENPNADPRATAREPDGELSRGLMQVKHSTAIDLGLRDPRRLADPWTGLYFGTLYLARQLRRYGGDVPDAIAAYNAGSAIRASSGRYVNQAYVDRALAFLRRGAAAPAPALVLGITVAATLAMLRAKGRAAA